METKESGFDAEKFQKLVAMFDTPYAEEAVTAFRAAMAQLKKDRLRFCDRLVDAGEAQQLRATIDRLRQQIAAMEAGTRGKADEPLSGGLSGNPFWTPEIEELLRRSDELLKKSRDERKRDPNRNWRMARILFVILCRALAVGFGYGVLLMELFQLVTKWHFGNPFRHLGWFLLVSGILAAWTAITEVIDYDP
jgi:hypothetical protein